VYERRLQPPLSVTSSHAIEVEGTECAGEYSDEKVANRDIRLARREEWLTNPKPLGTKLDSGTIYNRAEGFWICPHSKISFCRAVHNLSIAIRNFFIDVGEGGRWGSFCTQDAERGRSVLHTAIARGHGAVAEELVLAGADVAARDAGGRTPLQLLLLLREQPHAGCRTPLQQLLLQSKRQQRVAAPQVGKPTRTAKGRGRAGVHAATTGDSPPGVSYADGSTGLRRWPRWR
jgi:hypothetical protein